MIEANRCVRFSLSRGERVGVRGPLNELRLAEAPPAPEMCAKDALIATISPQAGRGEGGATCDNRDPQATFAAPTARRAWTEK